MAKKKSNNRSRKNSVVPSLAAFGAAPLFEGEDANAFSELLARLCDSVKPTSVIEEMWVQDCAYLYWDTLRMRRHKAELMNANMYQGLKIVLETLCPSDEADNLTSGWSVRDKEDCRRIDELLALGSLSMEAVRAQTLAVIINDIERIDRMVSVSEGRRNVVLREIERSRSLLGRALREATNTVEDAEFVELDVSPADDEMLLLETPESEAEELNTERRLPKNEAGK